MKLILPLDELYNLNGIRPSFYSYKELIPIAFHADPTPEIIVVR